MSKANFFECRFDAGEWKIFLTRDRMPDQAFEVRLDHYATPSAEAPSLCCGFSIFIERNETLEHVLVRLTKRLNHFAPMALPQEVESEFRHVASTWLLFNFGSTLDPVQNPSALAAVIKTIPS
jgi:hypothetical protein